MSGAEFFERLAKLEGVKWYLGSTGKIRGYHLGRAVCPVTALGEQVSPLLFERDADLLGLSHKVALNIATAADNRYFDMAVCEETLHVYRKKLLAATGLKDARA